MRENIPAWEATVNRLQGLCYLSKDDHNSKIIASKQKTDIGKYCFVNRNINLWNQLPVEG